MSNGKARDWAGVWVVDKPEGITSSEVVRRLKRRWGPLRIGHTGTLDPLATGVLPVCIGQATKLIPHMQLEPKVYRGAMVLGRETDTWDVTGSLVAERPVPRLSEEHLRETFARYEGQCVLEPPIYSAIKYKGKPLYAYARKGEQVRPAPRRVRVDSFRLLGRDGSTLEFELVCGRGTYVRSVVQSLGRILGCGACLRSLRRLRTGRFRIETSSPLKDLEAALEADAAREVLVSPEVTLDHLTACAVRTESEQKLRNGNPLREPDIEDATALASDFGAKIRVLLAGKVAAVAEIRKDTQGLLIQPVRVLCPDA